MDNILGVVSVQDFMLFPERSLEALMQRPLFVPEPKKISDLLAEFRRKRLGFAVCVDEYGGTAGIVTLEDILEEIFGEFYDEYAKVEHPIRPCGPQDFIVEAKISLIDFNEHFACELDSKEASTLGGYILEKLGEVPEKGKILRAGGLEIKILDVIGQRRIRSVVIKRVAS
jgi:CBS domain containing-hemolysin-like protein